MSPDVAIYVSTMRSDYRFAKALVASIEAHAGPARIFILPDDDYREPGMFGHPVWRPTDPNVLELVGFYKKLRVFWGPAERFLHLDADQLVLRDLGPLLSHLASKPRPFVFANRNTHDARLWDQGSDNDRARMFANRAGDVRLLQAFDPGFDWRARFPLNSGEFAASVDAIDRAAFLDVFAHAREFDRLHGPGIDLRFSRSGLFMSDQGFLHYFLMRHSPDVPIEWVDDVFRWGGRSDGLLPGHKPRNDWEGAIVHWAGCRRPGPLPLRPGVPRAAEWRRRYLEHCRKHGDWSGLISDSVAYATHTLREVASGWKRLLRERKNP